MITTLENGQYGYKRNKRLIFFLCIFLFSAPAWSYAADWSNAGYICHVEVISVGDTLTDLGVWKTIRIKFFPKESDNSYMRYNCSRKRYSLDSFDCEGFAINVNYRLEGEEYLTLVLPPVTTTKTNACEKAFALANITKKVNE
jgi:hypothetical protein